MSGSLLSADGTSDRGFHSDTLGNRITRSLYMSLCRTGGLRRNSAGGILRVRCIACCSSANDVNSAREASAGRLLC